MTKRLQEGHQLGCIPQAVIIECEDISHGWKKDKFRGIHGRGYANEERQREKRLIHPMGLSPRTNRCVLQKPGSMKSGEPFGG